MTGHIAHKDRSSKHRGLPALWEFLTRAHPRITDIEMRRQSSLLAGLMLAVILFSGIAAALLFVRNEVTPPLLGAGVLISLILYLVNRAGYYRWAAAAFIAQNFLLIYVTPIATNHIEWLFFATMTMILVAMLLPAKFSYIMFFLSLGAQLAIGRLHPLSGVFTNFGSTLIFFVTAPLILVFLSHRTQLERERQEEIREANARLRESETMLENRVKERTQELEHARNEAEIARAAAQTANEVKSRFLANMSHELRTPLNAILNFTAFVSDGLLGPVTAEQIEALSQSLSSGKHLLSLINDVLDITKIEAGMMQLFIQEVDFNEALDATVSVTKGLLQDKPVSLITDIDENLPTSFGDKRRIRQVFLNLISNAVKFTQEGSITIEATSHGDGITVRVSDTGIGIAPEDHALVFESFRQVTKHEMVDVVAGTGLGMPISRYFVESHGGKVWFKSQPGSGTTFTVKLPVLTREEAVALNANVEPVKE